VDEEQTMAGQVRANGFHDHMIDKAYRPPYWDKQFQYTFQNFFHPLVGDLLSQLNRRSLSGMLDAQWQKDQQRLVFDSAYHPTQDDLVRVMSFPEQLDVAENAPYANYNWELFFHIPLTVALHLSKTQRFAEAQRWFHFVFDPTSNDQGEPAPKRFWNFIAFRQDRDPKQIDYLLALLSAQPADLSGEDQQLRDDMLNGYTAILNRPFQPHAVARTRHLAYQYWVVMKYLDNLIAWGDHLFRQDTVESINEATQRYVLAASLLGPRPQRIPPRGFVRPQTFAQLKARPHDALGNAMVDLEGQFPFNLDPGPGSANHTDAATSPLFGIGHTLYFCIPRNDKLLGYWDTVADRLFKIRHCMNIAGVVRPLALFDPPIDPGMLVKAAAAGIDVASIVNGLNQPVGPVRCATMIQKSLELCGEVRSLGTALLSALEKGDAEHLAAVRQRHEIQIHQLTRGVRFLQWRLAQEQTQSLLTSRAMVLERFHYYQRLLGLPANPNVAETLVLQRPDLTEENFDEVYAGLVARYDKPVTRQIFPALTLAAATSPATRSTAVGQGRLYLAGNEDADLNTHGPAAREARLGAMSTDRITGILALIPDMGIDLHFWGLGGHANLFGGSLLAGAGRFISSLQTTEATNQEGQGASAVKTATFERRADDWLLQYNLAAHELMQNGRQILTSLIAEQIADHEYLNVQQQIRNSQEVDQVLHDKFTNEDLYLWMQGEISRLYYEYYRFAFDTARTAERTMKQELMRPDLDAQTFVKFNYWDGGRKGLLAGETLHLDVKRVELAYLENNKRELELTRHVSLRQLDPVALLTLRATGHCVVNVPEWLFDRDCPGHYMRRIKSVAVSVPSVVGPYTSLNCTLSLLRSSVRRSPVAGDDYARQGTEDERFIDYLGSKQSIVTSGGSNDSGLFETNFRDERYLPFEGAGAISSWRLDLPKDYRPFDYATISDIILHVRYTARPGVDSTKVKTALDALFQQADVSGLGLLFSLRHDFPSEWSAFVNSAAGANFTATISRDHFPYFTHGKTITIVGCDLYGPNGTNSPRHHAVGDQAAWDAATTALVAGESTFTASEDPPGPTQVLTRTADADPFLLMRYSLR
jgi:Tc toxin complex TcA C-terminal TcB-binding domain